MLKKAVIIDLDGTLIYKNTFKEFLKFIGIEAIKVFRLDIALGIFLFVLFRKMRFISHKSMKFHVLKISQSLTTVKKMEYFSKRLLVWINACVIEKVEYYKQNGYFICLSTAAPICYAKWIGKHLRFNGVLATPMPCDKWEENIREKKKDNTLVYLIHQNASLEILHTDHYDDVPLLSVPKERNYIVNPSLKTINMLNEYHIEYVLLEN